MNDFQGFLKFKRQDLTFRAPQSRVQDWSEMQEPHPESFFREQSTRCMDCGVAFCQGPTGCPVHNLIPEWNALVHQGQWKKAVDRLLLTNNFPEFTGRLCPAPCEGACVLDVHSEPVNIKAIEQSIIDRAFQEGWIRPQKPEFQTGCKVAIIGSGPAGLAAAQQLVRLGHSVVVFEKEKQVGGLLRYGIPDFKLDKSLIDRRLQQLKQEGVEFQTSTCFGRDITYESLTEEFDAIALAIGAESPRDLQIPGREFSGIHFAMDYLTDQNKILSEEISELSITAHQKKVIILGGGDTGSDCLGTALRQKASQVLQFEIQPQPPLKRSHSSPWPFWPIKLKTSHAHEEGGERYFSLSTKSFNGKNGQVTGLIAQKLNWQNGQALVSNQEDVHFEADLVLLALGFQGVRKELLSQIPGLQVDQNGKIRTDSNFKTGADKLYACGDSRRGASLIVWAIAEGRQMAASIHRTLMQNQSLLGAERALSS